jgi:hypothetical protein
MAWTLQAEISGSAFSTALAHATTQAELDIDEETIGYDRSGRQTTNDDQEVALWITVRKIHTWGNA